MRFQSLICEKSLAIMAKMAKDSPAGDFIEVGVFKGGSADILYEVSESQNRTLWLYDTFKGIPFKDEIDLIAMGQFSEGLSYEDARKSFPKAKIQEGIFPKQSLLPKQIAFVHLDVDQYQSYREGLDKLLPLIVPGGSVLCDDYGLPGAKKAIDETQWEKRLLEDGRMLFQC